MEDGEDGEEDGEGGRNKGGAEVGGNGLCVNGLEVGVIRGGLLLGMGSLPDVVRDRFCRALLAEVREDVAGCSDMLRKVLGSTRLMPNRAVTLCWVEYCVVVVSLVCRVC